MVGALYAWCAETCDSMRKLEMVKRDLRMTSTGTVCNDLAFSGCTKNILRVIVDISPYCNYNIILGSKFSTDTQTLSKSRDCLTQCRFPTLDHPQINSLGQDDRRLQTSVDDNLRNTLEVFAVPDTGAEVNVMSKRYGDFVIKFWRYVPLLPSMYCCLSDPPMMDLEGVPS